jgi:hypothetical protein
VEPPDDDLPLVPELELELFPDSDGPEPVLSEPELEGLSEPELDALLSAPVEDAALSPAPDEGRLSVL